MAAANMLTLILQTLEGHQIELNVQPEDTFADLKSQYANHEVLGLWDSLQQLITNGASVSENTKIFDYVTGSAHEWFSTDTVQEILPSQPTEPVTKFRECCARGCSNSELSTPGKPFFPLPTDHDRLTVCLNEIERPDLYDRILNTNSQECQKYFLCGSHISEESSFSSMNVAAEQPPNLSLLKPKTDRPRSNVIENTILTKEVEKKKEEQELNGYELREVNIDSKNSLLELFDSVGNFEHPGILCRLCGKLAANPIHLYALKTESIENEFSLADKINLCLPITISITDSLPKQICEDCHVKLDVCHELALSSLLAEDKLKILLRENKLCVDMNAEKRCPLCIEGDMRIVKKSGIYRREDLKDQLFSIKAEKNISPDNNFEIRSSNTKVQLPILDNFVCGSATIDDVLESRHSDNDFSLSLPNVDLSCSVCSSRIVDHTSVKTHDFHSENCISSRDCLICKNTNLTNLQDLEFHNSRHERNDDKKFVEATNSLKNLRAKDREIHCDNCDKIFVNEETSSNHDCSRVTKNSTRSKENFVGKPEFNNRSKKNESKVRYSCNFCEKEFMRKGSLEKHIMTLHNDTSKDYQVPRCYKCKLCCEAFAREIDALSHVRSKHQLSFVNDNSETVNNDFFIEQLIVTCLYVCEYCEHNFTIPSSLHEHRESLHGKIAKYSCVMCDHTFDSHRQLATHKTLRSHKKPLDDLGIKQLYVCKYCDKTFLHNSSHSSHVMQHRDMEIPYLCRICNVNFSNYREISKHRDEEHPYRSTLHERSSIMYNCQYCRKQFGQEVALIKHIRMHTGERPYKCTICGKGFSQSSGLYTHLRIHSDLRPYSCTKCPRTFKIKGDRDNHIKKHAGNRPYKCEYCNKAFMTQHVYSQHCKIHTNERPYKCDICGQAFRRSHVLTVHMRRHTGEKPHVCDMCPKTYRQRGDLSKHRKIQHGIINIKNSSNILTSNNRPDDIHDNFSKTSKFPEIRGSGESLLLLL